MNETVGEGGGSTTALNQTADKSSQGHQSKEATNHTDGNDVSQRNATERNESVGTAHPIHTNTSDVNRSRINANDTIAPATHSDAQATPKGDLANCTNMEESCADFHVNSNDSFASPANITKNNSGANITDVKESRTNDQGNGPDVHVQRKNAATKHDNITSNDTDSKMNRTHAEASSNRTQVHQTDSVENHTDNTLNHTDAQLLEMNRTRGLANHTDVPVHGANTSKNRSNFTSHGANTSKNRSMANHSGAQASRAHVKMNRSQQDAKHDDSQVNTSANGSHDEHTNHSLETAARSAVGSNRSDSEPKRVAAKSAPAPVNTTESASPSPQRPEPESERPLNSTAANPRKRRKKATPKNQQR
eukprot:gnl/TRDRNA2_/TRDRNA2_173727_c5_seq2.p1 gnl/TRDRNA2_/TRDRNA2_173727_c5~~gnl/TRDRNA2_/TRDRNA2_173727_c5_seq2.p1  ORF type:complete len:362 (-),score=47.30 gnl/TRDRNA2_/TRDRNA2_173727_c5_seq2:175-1260(-)